MRLISPVDLTSRGVRLPVSKSHFSICPLEGVYKFALQQANFPD